MPSDWHKREQHAHDGQPFDESQRTVVFDSHFQLPSTWNETKAVLDPLLEQMVAAKGGLKLAVSKPGTGGMQMGLGYALIDNVPT
jgi:hypothetical protein